MAGSGLYGDIVMDHFMNPRNMGEMEDADAVAEVGNIVCGDVMRVYLKIRDEIIEDVRVKTFGCGAAIASSSMISEMVKGKTIEQALTITNETVVEALGGLPETKKHCSVLAEDALLAALKNYYEQKGIDPNALDELKQTVQKNQLTE